MPILATFDDLAQALSGMGGPLLPLLLLVLVPIAALAAITLVQVRRHRQDAASRADAAFRLALAKRSLGARGEALARRLAAHAPDPLRRHDLLAMPRVFQAALERARRAGSLDDSEVAALRVALGFGAPDSERTLHSTAEIAVDTPLIVEQEKVRRLRAKTQAVETDGITILTEDSEVPPAPGANLQVYFKREAGVFTFTSRVLKLQGSRALIAHSERIGRYQKRRYFRRKLAIPVQVRVAGSDERPVQHRFLDLGGGGASITNTELRFRPGDDIEITFTPGAEGPIDLVGEVVRLSQAGKVMHVAFGPIREAMRDRIIGYILQAGRRR
jgi:c-di-GMP-binding flagellar brake protein YcgR